MGRLFDFLRRSRSDSSSTQNFSLTANTDVETHNQEVQGVGKKLVAKRGGSIIINENTQNLIINLTANDIPTNPEECAKLVSAMREAFDRKEIQLISKSAAEDIKDYNRNPMDDVEEEAMSYMKTIAPEGDILCMKTGLYVRSLNKRNKVEHAKLVRDRASRTPRARNIINLASAGFIEGYVVPVCKADENNAKNIYNDIVEDLPSIVFVNASMDVAKTMEIIEKKINDCEKYHWEISSISVNGLNSCVETILKVRDEIEKKYPTLKMTYNSSEGEGFRRGELRILLSNVEK